MVGRYVDVNELIERYPRLFHLAEAGSAPAISGHVIDVYRRVA